MKTVIGLTGYAGAGKSTVAEYLVNAHGFERVSFAAPLKKMLRTLDPIIGNTVTKTVSQSSVHPTHLSELAETENSIKAGPFGPEYRRLLQVLGTDCIRAVDEDFWVKAALKQMDNPEGKYVFDDVRFPNEAKVIQSLTPAGLWYVERPGVHAANGHSSEKHAGRMGETGRVQNPAYEFEFLHSQIDAELVQLQ